MDLDFEVGAYSTPAGHALVYFTSGSGEVFATYVQTFPIPMNLAQYMPPAFASLVPGDQLDSQGAMAMPPVLQPVEGGVDWLRRLAQARRDDLINAGTLYSTEAVNLMGMTQEAVAAYSALYQNRPELPITDQPQALNRYADLTEGERLAEMTMLVGSLRDRLGQPDYDIVHEELQGLADTMPAKYRSNDLLEAASRPGPVGQELAGLYVERAYKLLNEEYLEVADLERRIEALQVP